jgi:hypothetical protein
VNKKNREWEEAQGERQRKNHRAGERMCEEREKGREAATGQCDSVCGMLN